MSTSTLTKHEHACVTIERDGRTVLVDPGVFSPRVADLLATADALLVTHDHPDHLDVDAVRAALLGRPDLPAYAPAAAATLLGQDLADRVSVVEAGATFTAAGFEIRTVGGRHAVIHADLPAMTNVGYVLDGIYHPGDSYDVPDVEVDTLLLPTSGPWTKVSEAVDFVRAVRPRRSVQVHDGMLSAVGRGAMDGWVGAGGLTGVPLLSPEPGEAV